MIPFTLLLQLTIAIVLWNPFPHEAVAQPFAQAETSSQIETEEYLVYSALINERHSQPSAKRWFTLQGDVVKDRHVIDEVKLVVIESKTLHSFDYKPMDSENLRRTLNEKMPQVVEETFQDFTVRNRHPYTLSNNFRAQIETAVISEQERQVHFINSTGRADAFFARYPGSQGTLAFSRVGFNLSKDKALVYVDAREDFDAELRPLWTWARYFALLIKVKGRWTIQNVYYPNRPGPDSLRQRSLTVDLARCVPVSRSLSWGLGSATIEIKGREGDKCVLQHFWEIEGGYSQSECRVPTLVGEMSIYEGGSSFYYSLDVSKHCRVTKTGNLFVDRLKPE